MQARFSHVDTWIFDLDNTLYPPSADLFSLMDVKMENFLMREFKLGPDMAARLREDYWHEFGNTLYGLILNHKIDPMAYLEEVHDIDLSHMVHDPELASAIKSLPGRKVIYTNGSRNHAEKVTAACGIDHLFDDMFGLEQADFLPKPAPEAFAMIFDKARIEPKRSAFFEDELRNLETPKKLGMATVLVGKNSEADFVDFHTPELTGFLSDVVDQVFNADAR